MSGIGDYDRFCEVQSPDNERGSAGGVKRRWTTVFSFFASKIEAETGQFTGGDKPNVDVDAVFRTHYNAAITDRMRFVCDGSVYEVVGKPRQIGRQEAMLIQAKTLPE